METRPLTVSPKILYLIPKKKGAQGRGSMSFQWVVPESNGDGLEKRLGKHKETGKAQRLSARSSDPEGVG